MIDKPVFILPSVSDRVESLNRFLLELRSSPYKDWAIALYYQDYQNNAKDVRFDLCDHYIINKERVGVGNARYYMLQTLPEYKYYGHIDDDMFLLPQTNYFPMLKFLDDNEHVGHVMSAWVRYEAGIEKAVARLDGSYSKQTFIYTGGGQFYRNDVCRLYKRPLQIGRHDDETVWTLLAYLEGYDNYVYHGSLALHKTLQKGGTRAQVAVTKKYEQIGFPNFINYHYTAQGMWAIPLDKDIKPNTKKIHKEKQRQRFGDCRLILNK